MIYAKRVKKTNQKKVMDSGQSDIRHNGHGIRGFETSMPLHLAPHAPPRAARSFWLSRHAPTRRHAPHAPPRAPRATRPTRLTRPRVPRASRAHAPHTPRVPSASRASRAHAPHAPHAAVRR